MSELPAIAVSPADPMKRLLGLTEQQWNDLARRVGHGAAVERDADYVEALGLMPQATRIRQGIATDSDGVLINLRAGMRLLGIEVAQPFNEGAKVLP